MPESLIAGALELEVADGTIVGDSVDGTPCVFLAGLHAAERVIARAHPQPLRRTACHGARSTRTGPSHGSRRGWA